MLKDGPAIKVPTPKRSVKQPNLAGAPNQPDEEEVGEDDDSAEEEASEKKVDRSYLTSIASRLEKLAADQVTAKATVEQRWLKAVRIYHGKYDPAFLAKLVAAGVATANVKMVRAKTVALEARLFDLMFPTDDRNWDINATPVPKLSDEKKEAENRAKNAAQQANEAQANNQPELAQQMVQAGQDQADRADAAATEIEAANQAVKLMREEIDDQLIEARYPAEFRKGIHDFAQLGSMIFKGPVVNEKTRGRWIPMSALGAKDAQDHEYQLKQTEDMRPMVRRVDPWAYFPDMSARSIEECEFHFERYLWTKTDLRRMIQTHGFDPDAVRELLEENPAKARRNTTMGISLNNLVQLRAMTDDSSGQITGRYIGWEYHGPLECQEVCAVLRAFGKHKLADEYEKNDDPLNEFRVILHFCNGQVLKIAPEWPMDSGESLYSMANLEEAEGQLFGYGIPTIAEDSSDSLNSAWRMALDNGALSVGPQAVIDKTAITPADGQWSFSPRKIWYRVKAALSATDKAVDFFDIPNNMEEINLIIELAARFIDMETGIPQPQTGEEAKATPTVGGMAILQSSSNILYRRTVKNLDDGIIAPIMRRFYDWNMQFSKRAEIKGDMQVEARGASALLVKEVEAQNLMVAAQTLLSHPTIGPMIKAYPLVEKLFRSMMIRPSEVLVSEDAYKQYLEDKAKQPPPKSPQEIMAESQIERAKIAAEASKMSDETNKLIADLRERTAMIELATKGEISMRELQAMLAGKKMDNDHKERALVAEAAIDRQNAQDAREHGEVPGGSGGNFNEGPAPKKAA